jgi:hypothetical protein
MARYRKRPVKVEAMRYTGENGDEIALFAGRLERNRTNQLVIPTLEGKMFANPGDWIIRGLAGEFYPCRADIFDATYEPVD